MRNQIFLAPVPTGRWHSAWHQLHYLAGQRACKLDLHQDFSGQQTLDHTQAIWSFGMDRALIDTYSGSVPRYTSYPTAPHFHPGIDTSVYAGWLANLGLGQSLSLYVHIPYCDRLCWFCACHTKHTLQYAPVAQYLKALHREIETVGHHVSPGAIVTSLHFGGGSPTMMRPDDLVDLMQHLKSCFTFAPGADISVEMDPNDLDEGRFDALAEIGMTRASLGIQDFDPKVQDAINRIQTFEQTRHVVESVRRRGVGSVNCDVLYGLPYQT
ncbi:MAG: oxygen-independent coproporphyrinogen oxidase, partial [Pseudomonadota bacterium]